MIFSERKGRSIRPKKEITPTIFRGYVEKGPGLWKKQAKMLFLRHIEVDFCHIEVQVLELMDTQREAEMPPVFPPPHLYI